MIIKGLSRTEWFMLVASLAAKRFQDTQEHTDLTRWCDTQELVTEGKHK